MQRAPFLPRNLHHRSALVDKGQAAQFPHVVIEGVSAGADADFEHVAVGLGDEAAAEAGDAGEALDEGYILVEVGGCGVVAGGDVGVLLGEGGEGGCG